MEITETIEESLDLLFEPRAARGRRKGNHRKEIRHSKESKFSPEQFIEKHIETIKRSSESFDKEKQDAALSSYFDWVKKSIEIGETHFDDSDLEITSSDQKHRQFTKVTHLPTQFFGRDIGTADSRLRLINAKSDAYLRVDNHFNLWKKTSESFKEKYLK